MPGGQQQIKVKVTFDYYPDLGDPDDSTGMEQDEYDDLMEKLSALGADGIEIERVDP